MDDPILVSFGLTWRGQQEYLSGFGRVAFRVLQLHRPMRRLGTTGLVVSHVGLGLAALGRPDYINLGHAGDLGPCTDLAAMEAHSHEAPGFSTERSKESPPPKAH